MQCQRMNGTSKLLDDEHVLEDEVIEDVDLELWSQRDGILTIRTYRQIPQRLFAVFLS